MRAFLDRAPAEVTRATLAEGYVGLYLIELQIPAIVNAATQPTMGREVLKRMLVVILQLTPACPAVPADFVAVKTVLEVRKEPRGVAARPPACN